MLKDLNPTVRRYPNTLQDAFPQHYPEWFEKHKKPMSAWTIPAWLFFLAVISYVAFK
jgi:hypothetical protein